MAVHIFGGGMGGDGVGCRRDDFGQEVSKEWEDD